MNLEKWVDIEDYEGLYQMSNKGRIKSFKHWNGSNYIYEERVFDGWVNVGKNGYERQLVNLSKDKESKQVRVSRLVATHFIPNPENKPEVNHKDGDPLNNDVNNLEWVTRSENMQHAYDTGLKDSFRQHEDDIVNDYVSGMGQKQIAKKYSCGYESIVKLLKEKGVPIRGTEHSNNIYKIDKHELAKDFNEGTMSNRELAEKYNTNNQLIATYKYRHKKGEFIK